MRKFMTCTNYLVVHLYTENDVIILASINTSASRFNVSNLSIYSVNTMFTNTNKHTILLANAFLFENETDIILFSFDMIYVICDSVYGFDDFELRLNAYESVITSDFITSKFIVDYIQ